MSSRDQSGASLYLGNRIVIVVLALGVLSILGFGVLAWRPAIAPAAPRRQQVSRRLWSRRERRLPVAAIARLAIPLKAARASLAVMQCRPLLG
jgi:uncharacterized iron-regulated membrane protein